jgi:hypothetical protein
LIFNNIGRTKFLNVSNGGEIQLKAVKVFAILKGQTGNPNKTKERIFIPFLFSNLNNYTYAITGKNFEKRKNPNKNSEI